MCSEYGSVGVSVEFASLVDFKEKGIARHYPPRCEKMFVRPIHASNIGCVGAETSGNGGGFDRHHFLFMESECVQR